ncbi:hypothetical protein Tco_0203525, partial [Tanacetum coccineum]
MAHHYQGTDKEDTIVHTGQDPIHECHSLMSKAKYVTVSQKHNPNVKSPTPIKGCVLGLANVETWDNTVNKFGMRTPGRCADKSKACTLHLQLADAHCICTLHLQLAFASKHLHIAFAD